MDEDVHRSPDTARRRSSAALGDAKNELKETEKKILGYLHTFLCQEEIQQEIAPICEEVLDYYHKGGAYREVTFELVPAFLECYMFARAQGYHENLITVGTLLLTIYNCELQKEGRLKGNETVRLPSSTVPTIYKKEPVSVCVHEELTEKQLAKMDHDVESCAEIGPYLPISTLNAGNRFSMLTYVVRVYNSRLHKYSTASVNFFCRMCCRLCQSGFPISDDQTAKLQVDRRRRTSGDISLCLDNVSSGRRISVSAHFLREILNGIQYVLYNRDFNVALKAVHAVHFRAQYELYSDVLLMTSSMLDTMSAFKLANIGHDAVVGVQSPLATLEASDLPVGSTANVISRASFKIRRFSRGLINKTKAAVAGESTENGGIRPLSSVDSGQCPSPPLTIRAKSAVAE